MFTGLIEEVGIVEAIHITPTIANISIKAKKFINVIKIGDSIATNGVCLTVTTKTPNGFTADVMPATLYNTNLGDLKSGDSVNLERAMTLSSRLDGHIVTGHIDAKGKIISIYNDGNAVRYKIQLSEDVMSRMINNGSIAIDGISLTIQNLYDDGVEVSVIPHTASETTLSLLKNGDYVNVESDVIGKYVQRLLGKDTTKDKVNMEFLTKCGFL